VTGIEPYISHLLNRRFVLEHASCSLLARKLWQRVQMRVAGTRDQRMLQHQGGLRWPPRIQNCPRVECQ